jgi:hypothetical protein
MSAIEMLIEHWRKFSPDREPYLHSADAPHVADPKNLKFNLLPYPFVGDIAGADVWVLMLNSNIGDRDEIDEEDPQFRKRQCANLRQDFSGLDYPLLSLDPVLSGTGTYQYYNVRNGFYDLIAVYGARAGIPLEEARKIIARRVAVLQLLPYRSKSGQFVEKLSSVMPSSRLVYRAVQETISERHKLIIVPRSATLWGLKYEQNTDGVITYRADQARSGSLKPAAIGGKCAGGDAVVSWLLEHQPVKLPS